MNTGDTAFVLMSAAFVFFMTPGLAFFYGGLVRRKNVCNTMMACAAIMGLSVVMWALFGYSLSFGGNHGGIIGDFRWFRPESSWHGSRSLCGQHSPSGILCLPDDVCHDHPCSDHRSSGGTHEIQSAVSFHRSIGSVIVYYPMAHMVWGEGGFLASIGSVDFAGGNVVHISSGVSALVLAIILGRRTGYEHTSYRVHNVPFVFLGAAILWFGWFGFNAGSALGANGLAAHAFMTSAISAATALLSWMLIDVIKGGRPTLVGASTGLVVGLVAITPGAGFVPVWSSFIIGALVSPICYFGVKLVKKKLKIDDALDAFGCHGIGGIWGGIAPACLPRLPSMIPPHGNGLVFGDHRLFAAQIIGILVTAAVAVVGTLICTAIVRLITPLRVNVKEEKLDWI